MSECTCGSVGGRRDINENCPIHGRFVISGFPAALETAVKVALSTVPNLDKPTKDAYEAGIRYGFTAGWDARGKGK